jgi:SAM-dependent methyltransferase
LLAVERLTNRLAYEMSSTVFPDFYQTVRAIDEEVLDQTIPRGATVLDLGCGSGQWPLLAAEQAAKVLAIDTDGEAISRARSNTSATNVEFIVGDIANIPGEDCFDVALLKHIIEHVDDPIKVLSKLHTRARTLLIEVPDFDADPLNGCASLGCDFSSDSDRVREFTEGFLVDLLAGAGWQPIKVWKHAGTIGIAATDTGLPAV